MFKSSTLLERLQSNKTYIKTDPDGVEVYAELEIEVFSDSRYKSYYTEYRGRTDKFSSRIHSTGETVISQNGMTFEGLAEVLGGREEQYMILRLISNNPRNKTFLLERTAYSP